MTEKFTAAALSLVAAGTWGAGDFSGGVAAKRANAFRVVLVAHGAAFLLMLALALFTHESFLSRNAFIFAAGAGLAGGIALATFYRSLAVGKMGINAPVAGVLTAFIPAVFGIVTQGSPGRIQLIGMFIALIGIVLVSKPEKTQGFPPGLGLAIAAGFGFGFFIIFLQQAGKWGVFYPLAVARVFSTLLMIVLCAVARVGFIPERKVLPVAALAGFFDSVGTACLLIATRYGRLDESAVLSSLYPVVTVVLARLVYKERLTKLQDVGMLITLCAVPMIAR